MGGQGGDPSLTLTDSSPVIIEKGHLTEEEA